MKETLEARITAHALGQSDAREAAEIEALARRSPEVRDGLERTRALAETLGTSLGAVAGRWSAGLSAERRAALLTAQTRPRRGPGLAAGLPARWRPLAALGGTLAGLFLLFLVSPAGTTAITATYAWLDQVKSSTGHQSATRTVYEGPMVTIWDVLQGRRPSDYRQDLGGWTQSSGYGPVAAATDRGLAPRGQTARQSTAQHAAPVDPAAAGAPDLPRPAPNPMVVKDADIVLRVGSVRFALGRVTAIAGQYGGFVRSSEAHRYETLDELSQDYSYASLVLSVPAGRFEALVSDLRALADGVQQESISGTDVTEDYVDMESQVANLEATRTRVRAFLDQAATVDEALRVNAELSRLEGEINVLKGRMTGLADRVQYATVRVELVGPAQAALLAEPQRRPWSPRDTARAALGALTWIARATVSVGIWLVIVGLPICLPFWAVAWILHQRKRG